MVRALWSGAIRFGLVNVPVKLYKATGAASGRGISFHQLHEVCGTRIQHRRVCPHCDREVPWDEVAKGYEFENRRYALLTDEDFAGLPREDEAAIAIEDFVPANQVDPVLHDRAYWIAPDGPPHAYGLLHHALVDTGKVAVGRLMLRTRAHLALVRPDGDRLVLETMFFADELVRPADIPGVPASLSVPPREAQLAKHLVETMTVPFQLEKYRDTYAQAVRAVIEKKIEGREVVESAFAPPPPTRVVDIMEALRKSLDSAKGERPVARPPSPPGAAPVAEAERQPARRRAATSTHARTRRKAG